MTDRIQHKPTKADSPIEVKRLSEGRRPSLLPTTAMWAKSLPDGDLWLLALGQESSWWVSARDHEIEEWDQLISHDEAHTDAHSMRGSVSAEELDDAAHDLWVTEGDFIAQHNRNPQKWAELEPETRDRYRAMAEAALKAVDVALDSWIEEEEK